MKGQSENLTLNEAAGHFLASLAPEEKAAVQPDIYGFVRWFGRECPIGDLTPAEVGNYAERLSVSDTDYMKKLEVIRSFLAYAKKAGWSKTNLATHLKAKKRQAKPKSVPRPSASGPVVLTQEGYARLETELSALRSRRHEVIDEIRRAAADKDFRENVPLQAAREEHSHLEGRIIELEETLKSAVFIEQKAGAVVSVGIGDGVVVIDLESAEELHYTLVGPREVDLSRGLISSLSPLGQALLGKSPGSVVEITAPAGKLHYRIERIEHHG
jgi:transcription elongation factor GreA